MNNFFKKNKVILSAYACSPVKGAEEGIGWNWAINIAKQGYEVWCITNTQNEDDINYEKQRLGINNLNFVFVKVPFGVDKTFFDPASKKVYLHYLLWRRAANKIVQKMHNEIRFDIAHHVTYGSLQQGTFLWRLKGVKLIFGPVGGGQVALPSLKQYFGKEWNTEIIRNIISKASFLFSKSLKQTLKHSNHILVANKDTEELIKATKYYDKSKVHLVLDNAVPNSMEKIGYEKKNYGNKIKLLWVGRVLPRKGLNLVLHALSYIPEYVNYELTIVGGGPWFKNIESWIAEYNLNINYLKITGSIPFSEVMDHYRNSDIFVFCSLRDSCGVQINEAMAFGLPQIVLNIHGSALAVSDNCGIKIDATTPDDTARAIAEAITTLSSNKEQLEKMSYSSYLNAKSNTWQKKVETVTNSYY